MSIYKAKRVRFLSSRELEDATREMAELSSVPMAIAGGYAMQIYGSDRYTTDLDLLALRAPADLPKLRDLSFGGFATKTSLGTPVDIIVRDDDFKKLYRDAVRTARPAPGLPLRVVSAGHLIAMKMAAGRAKDDLDLDFLLPRMTAKELADAREVVVRHLGGAFAGRKFDARLAEARWRYSRDPNERRRRRHVGKR